MSVSVTLSDAMLVDAAREEAARRKTDVLTEVRPRSAPRPWHQRIGAEQPASRDGRPLLVLCLFAVALVAMLGLRKTIVAAVPETAVLYQAAGLPVNLRGLELRGVKSMIFRENGVDLLVVQGDIANVVGSKQPVPPLRFIVRDDKGTDVYSWVASADVRSLDPGGKATFRRRLASPPAEGVEVLVRFAGKPGETAISN